MKKAIILFLQLILITGLSGTINKLSAQDEKKETTMEFTTWKYANGTRNLVAKMTSSGENGEMPVEGLTVSFYCGDNGNVKELGNTVTASDGKAVLTLDSLVTLLKDKEGYTRFFARFEENEKYTGSEGEVKLKDARIALTFEEVDSVRKILYSGRITDPTGNEIPLANTDVFFYVPRMFSMLKIADGWLEESGEGSSDFPEDLIGDSLGVVTIYARIEENADFGNLEASGTIDWARKKHGEGFEGPQRELWTPIAPMWMIITLIVMLTGVWGHYMYAIIQLIMIYKVGKKHNLAESSLKNESTG